MGTPCARDRYARGCSARSRSAGRMMSTCPLPDRSLLLSYPQAQSYPSPADGATQPARRPVFGLGLTTGILGILSSLWLTVLGIGMYIFAHTVAMYGGGRLFVISEVLSSVLFVLALLMFVLGVLSIVKNRQRGVRLLTALLAVSALSVVVAIVAGALGYAGAHFWVLSTVIMLPLIIVSFLAVLAARKTAE
jgi:hypothetical protein